MVRGGGLQDYCCSSALHCLQHSYMYRTARAQRSGATMTPVANYSSSSRPLNQKRGERSAGRPAASAVALCLPCLPCCPAPATQPSVQCDTEYHISITFLRLYFRLAFCVPRRIGPVKSCNFEPFGRRRAPSRRGLTARRLRNYVSSADDMSMIKCKQSSPCR